MLESQHRIVMRKVQNHSGRCCEVNKVSYSKWSSHPWITDLGEVCATKRKSEGRVNAQITQTERSQVLRVESSDVKYEQS